MKETFKVFILVLLCSSSLKAFTGGTPHHAGIHFIENKNQWRDEVRFAAPITHGDLYLFKNKFTYQFSDRDKFHHLHNHGNLEGFDVISRLRESRHRHDHEGVNYHVYDVAFLGYNPDVCLVGGEQLTHRYNYFIGNDPNRWGSDAKAFYKVNYQGLYYGIDMEVYNAQGSLKYDLVVSPEGDPNDIRFQYNGLDNIELRQGSLYLKTSLNEVIEKKPYAYQFIDGQKVPVVCQFVLNGNELSFDFPLGYDDCHDLIIDPLLIFSAYSGSTYDNWGNTATFDESGNVYSGGMVSTVNAPPPAGVIGSFPLVNPAQNTYAGGQWDMGILKFDSIGSELLYATFLGGNGTETPQSLVANSKGELIILGATSSTNFPVTNGSTFSGGTDVEPIGAIRFQVGSDLFVTKLSQNGNSILGSTYLGGSANDGVNFIEGNLNVEPKRESPIARNYGDQLRGDVIVDKDDFVYIASNTLSNDFLPAESINSFAGGSHDAVVVKLEPDLDNVVWSRYLGGSATDAAYSIKLDAANNIYLTGGTTSTNFPGVNGLRTTYSGSVDGWVAKLSADGEDILNATYIGTTRYDQAYFIDLDVNEDVYLFGQTQGNYPVVGNVFSEAAGGQFIHKLTNNLSTTVFSTVFGSGSNRPDISPTAFLVSECDNIYISGWGGQVNTPTVGEVTRNFVGGSTNGLTVTSDAFDPITSGSDFYLMVLSGDASELLYATFLGGNVSNTHVDGGTSRFDKRGIVYHAVCAGCGGNVRDFPSLNVSNEFSSNRSQNCNNAVFKFDLASLRARLRTNSLAFDAPGLNSVCFPDTIVFENFSIGGQLFEWDFGDGTSTVRTDTLFIPHVYPGEGRYLVKLTAIDANTCIGIDSVQTFVDVFESNFNVVDDDMICFGDQFRLSATGGVSYQWTNADSTFQSTEPSPLVSPEDTTTYFVFMTDANGCTRLDSVKVDVVPEIRPDFVFERINDCFSRTILRVENRSEGAESILWDFGDGTTSEEEEVIHEFEADAFYPVRLLARNEFCVEERVINMPIFTLRVPNVFTPESKDGLNDSFAIESNGDRIELRVYNRWGKLVFESDDYLDGWTADDVSSGVYYYETILHYDVEGRISDVCKGWINVIK